MKNALNSVKVSTPATSGFNLSHDIKVSGNMGFLIPALAWHCMPGTRVRLGCENLIRLVPMLAPIMHRVDVRVEYFFCPDRLVWENFETWISNGGSDSVQVDPLPAHPTFLYSEGGLGVQFSTTPLLDYMRLPNPLLAGGSTTPEKVSALPLGAYQKICQDFYRDENLMAMPFAGPAGKSGYTCVDGDNSGVGALFTLRRRCWEADYFTKALPFAQKGGEVDIPLGDVVLTQDLGGSGKIRVAATHALSGGTTDGLAVAAAAGVMLDDSVAAGGVAAVYDPDGTLETTPTTINDLRLAYRLQEWLEKNARGGTRYAELIRSHFNVSPQDSRLQRPEYIVGIKNPIQVSEVLQTSETDQTPQGTMAGHGVSYSQGNYGKYFCTEHGYIIGILSVMPKTAYYQGIPKHFLRYNDPTEYPWPTFANLGEQEILTKEIMAFQGATGEVVWGYTPRYMEEKFISNGVTGEFQDTLNFWHMAREFSAGSPPLLNADFVQADPTHRIFAVTDPDEDKLLMQLRHDIFAVMCLPKYGTPTF